MFLPLYCDRLLKGDGVVAFTEFSSCALDGGLVAELDGVGLLTTGDGVLANVPV